MPVSALRSGGDLDGFAPAKELAPELGLHGIPTRGLVEFEGGGSMLSREVLGEMLSVNEHGVLNRRGCAGKSASGDGTKRDRRQRAVVSTSRRWAQGSDGGVAEEGKQGRLLCQADALKRLRKSSATPSHASSRRPSVDARASTKRGFKGREEAHVEHRRVFALTADGDDGKFQASASPTRFEGSSPNKRRRHKLYDHDHNPRVLRKLVDDTLITGIAGAGALRAQEGGEMDALRLQLRLACHRATELEEQIFQSQTGAPHRELLGELQLDRTGDAAVPPLERPGGNEKNAPSTSQRRGVEVSAEVDLFKRRRTRTQGQREPLDVSFPTRKGLGPPRHTGGVGGGKDSITFRWEASIPEVLNNCQPLPSTPLTPTASLRRYLSSLRPFSADSARAAWGLTDRAGSGGFAGPGADHRLYNGDTGDRLDSGQHRWPVLFVMGSSKPPPVRHPLGVHALPMFDDDLLGVLAAAAGEPVERIRAMTTVLSRFDFRLLQSAVTRIFSAHAIEGAYTSSVAHGGRRRRQQRKGSPGPATQAWARIAEDGRRSGGVAAAAAAEAVESSRRVERQVEGDEEPPLIMSEAAAGRALAAGFLSGVFGETAVRDIVAAARPVVVFDSAEMAVAEAREGSAGEGIPVVEFHKETDRRPADGTDRNRRYTVNFSGPCDGKAGVPSDNVTKDEGVLVVQLVRAAAARFRVHSLAVRHRDSGDTDNIASSSVFSSPTGLGLDGEGLGKGLFIGGSGGSGWADGDSMPGPRLRRPASAGSDELGLPPLKLARKRRRGGRLSKAGGRPKEEEADVDVFGVPRGRSTPRCLRPGYEGEVTAAMLRQELETSESAAARLGITMARKAEAWKLEAQDGGTAEAVAAANAEAAAAAANRAALALASTRAREALLEAGHERMREAVDLMYLGIVRRSWNAWKQLNRQQQSLEAAERVARLVGAAAIGFGVLEPLLRRRTRKWVRRWAGAMRAERVLEVQAAAVELQRVVRGFLGRRRAEKKQHDCAALAVQRVARGHAGRLRGARRARMMKEWRAVRTIEQKYREFVWQRDAVKLLALKKKDRAATKVQAAWRAMVYGRRPVRRLRELRKEEVSALMLQRLWRGVVARGRADVLMEEKRRRGAAVRIQAVARGHGTRNVYGPILLRERSASTMCRFWRCARARQVTQGKRRSKALAARVNPLVRGFLARRATKKMFEELHRRNRAILLVCVAAQKMFRGKQGRLKARRELLRQCAAVELQRIVRGRAVRRVAEIDEARSKHQASSWMAAVAVQRLWRGLKGRKLGQREAEKRIWDAAFTIQTAHRRMHMRRRRRARALKRDMGASNAAAACNQNLEHGHLQTEAAAARGEGELDGGNDSVGAEGIAPSGGGAGRRNGRRQLGVAAAVSPPADGGIDNTTTTGSGAAKTVRPTGDEGNRPDDQPPSLGAGGSTPSAAAPTESEFEDLGDVAFAAVKFAQSPPPAPPPSMPPPAKVVQEPRRAAQPVSEAKPVSAPPTPAPGPPAPVQEETLEYYEAKMRYLAAQEKAHGGSACKIQASKELLQDSRQRMIPLRAERDKKERQLAEERRAVAVLQSAARTRAAWRAVARRKAEILEAERREQGLLTIQCAVRCFLAKCRLQRLVREERARQERINRMAARIQARVRGIQTRDIWRKFFKSRALLQRERERKGAQQIQASWRSKLARTEAERRRSVRDAALLAEKLERHLNSLLESKMEVERRHAYATRLQCWWRCILAVRVKLRRLLALKETPLEDVEEEAEKAALVLQCNWRAIQARRYFNANYALLYRERERRLFCTECQAEYATRKCDTCLDKFCEGCWARIHSTGGATPSTATTTATADSYYSDASQGHQRGAERAPWAVDQPSFAVDPNSYYMGYDTYNPGGEYYGYHTTTGGGENAYQQDWQSDHQQQAGWVQSWSPDASQQWYDPSQSPSQVSSADYGGAESYDGAAASDYHYPEWTSGTPVTPDQSSSTGASNGWGDATSYGYGGSGGGGGEEIGEWAVAVAAETPQEWDSSGLEAAGYYGYDAAGGAEPTGAKVANTGWDEGWATAETAETTAASGLFAGGGNGSGGGVTGNDTADMSSVGGNSMVETPPSGGSSSGRSWSVNEYGQRVAGDWVEYYDESAQAVYFYNTVSGEASWTEPATG
eukprot:g15710.t1